MSSLAPDSSRGGSEWVRLNPAGSSAAASGCIGVGCLAFGVLFAAVGVGALIVSGSLAVAFIVLAGLVVAAIGGWSVLAAIGPRPRLWADQVRIAAGTTLRVRWETSSRFKEASSIRITWEAREVAIERGYDATFHRSSFVVRVVTSEIGPLAGMASIPVPQLTMPSFAAKNALIEWRLLADVQTRKWPNVAETYAIVVLPSRAETR